MYILEVLKSKDICFTIHAGQIHYRIAQWIIFGFNADIRKRLSLSTQLSLTVIGSLLSNLVTSSFRIELVHYCSDCWLRNSIYHCCLESEIVDSGLKVSNSLPSLLKLFFLSIILIRLCTICVVFVSPGKGRAGSYRCSGPWRWHGL